MEVQKELKKIEKIMDDGLFIYNGVRYDLDANATSTHPLNVNLGGKPLKKLVGTGAGGTVHVWSHDCTAVEGPVMVIPVMSYVEPAPKPVKKVKKKSSK